jgi:hypothetical protein
MFIDVLLLFVTATIYLITPWSRVLLETLQLVKKFLAFMEPESSLPYSQMPANCPHNPLPIPEDPS